MSAPKHNCYGCENRAVGCHSVCEDYLTYRRKHEEYQKIILESKQKEALHYK